MVKTRKNRKIRMNKQKRAKDKLKIIERIDNLNLATDYKNNNKLFKLASDEYRRRLRVTLKKNKHIRRIFNNKTKKKYNKKNIHKILEKIPIPKVQKLYFLMLDKEKSLHSTKK